MLAQYFVWLGKLCVCAWVGVVGRGWTKRARVGETGAGWSEVVVRGRSGAGRNGAGQTGVG